MSLMSLRLGVSRLAWAALGLGLGVTQAVALGGCELDPHPVAHGPVAAGVSARLGEPVPYASPEQLAAFARGRQVSLRRFDRRAGLGPLPRRVAGGDAHRAGCARADRAPPPGDGRRDAGPRARARARTRPRGAGGRSDGGVAAALPPGAQRRAARRRGPGPDPRHRAPRPSPGTAAGRGAALRARASLARAGTGSRWRSPKADGRRASRRCAADSAPPRCRDRCRR